MKLQKWIEQGMSVEKIKEHIKWLQERKQLAKERTEFWKGQLKLLQEKEKKNKTKAKRRISKRWSEMHGLSDRELDIKLGKKK